MKSSYNQSDLRSHNFTKFHQNLTHNYGGICFKSRTDRQSRGERRPRREGQINGTKVTVNTVTINLNIISLYIYIESYINMKIHTRCIRRMQIPPRFWSWFIITKVHKFSIWSLIITKHLAKIENRNEIGASILLEFVH